MKKGTYCLATKWHDGDPLDHWYVGWFRCMLGDRYEVEDADGNLVRGNGFRRCDKISPRVGCALVSNTAHIQIAGMSVWYWRYHPGQLPS